MASALSERINSLRSCSVHVDRTRFCFLLSMVLLWFDVINSSWEVCFHIKSLMSNGLRLFLDFVLGLVLATHLVRYAG